MKRKSNNLSGGCRRPLLLFIDLTWLLQGWIMFSCILSVISCTSTSEKSTFTPLAKVSPLAEIKYAKGFSIHYYQGYNVVNIIDHFEDNRDTIKYVLVERGTAPPSHLAHHPTIFIPVRTMVGMSSLHIALADFLDATEILVGLGNFQYVNSEKVLENIASGKIKEVGIGASVNSETIIEMKPDLVMAMGSPDAKLPTYQQLTDLNIPVMINAEWLEKSPLGRAEWVKLMGALLNKEELANRKFQEIEKEYYKLAKLSKSATDKPSVILDMSFKDVWHVPDGDSYVAELLRDAGARYKWFNKNGKGSLPLDFETVYSEGLTAEYWLNLNFVESRKDILEKDVRYGDFKSFKEGRVFNNNRKTNARGSNDYWESGVVNPHLILADLIKILHPELLPDYQLTYYKQVL